MPELDGTLLWNIIITMVIVPFGWAFNKMFSEVKRLQLLLSETRESYSTKQDLRDTSTRIIETLHRLEDKLDKVLTNGSR
tara:strand:- start:607 stop:846 length:240 start_codon:yes stop_codon:yes gene_type:complete